MIFTSERPAEELGDVEIHHVYKVIRYRGREGGSCNSPRERNNAITKSACDELEKGGGGLQVDSASKFNAQSSSCLTTKKSSTVGQHSLDLLAH